VRLRIPLGNPGWSLDLSASGGASRVAREGGLVAVIPANLDGSGFAHLQLASTAGGLSALAEVVVEGPVSDAVLLNDVLYVGGARLGIFDLADPENPIVQPEVDLFAGQSVAALVLDGSRLWALGAEGGDQRLLAVDLSSALAPVAVSSESLLVANVAESRIFALAGDLYRIGAGRVERFDLSPSSPPALAAIGSPAGVTMIDLESAGGALFVAARGQGARELVETAGALTLRGAPSPAQAAAGLFMIPEAGGERLWRSAGLPGAVEVGSAKRAPTGCLLRDVVVSASDLLLLTGCGLEREVLP
jgi:hypothetical protein